MSESLKLYKENNSKTSTTTINKCLFKIIKKNNFNKYLSKHQEWCLLTNSNLFYSTWANKHFQIPLKNSPKNHRNSNQVSNFRHSKIVEHCVEQKVLESNEYEWTFFTFVCIFFRQNSYLWCVMAAPQSIL